MSEEKGLRIIELKAENVKKLKAIEIKPEGNTVVISGKNENGKTSVLDAIFLALGGKVASKGVTKPIRDGEESAYSRVDLGDIIVTRKWTGNDKSYLTVENRDGAVFKSPQAILDNLIGNLSFDPLAFSNMDDKSQREILLDLVNIDLDLEQWEIDRKRYYDDRTEVNRKVKELNGQIAGINIPEDTPAEEVKTSTILEEIEEAQKVQNANDEKRRVAEALRQDLVILANEKENIEGQISNLQQELEVKQIQIRETRSNLQTMNPELAALVDPDMEVFKGKLANIEETNEQVREKLKKVDLQAKMEAEEKDSQRLTEEINEMDVNKAKAIEAAEFPIEHLGFDEDGVTYKGIPFGQCSAAESLRVSLSIAIAVNPKLRVLRIMDGSLLDKDNMKIIEEMVKEHDYQVWVELVREEPDGASVFIEDGEVKEEKS